MRDSRAAPLRQPAFNALFFGVFLGLMCWPLLAISVDHFEVAFYHFFGTWLALVGIQFLRR